MSLRNDGGSKHRVPFPFECESTLTFDDLLLVPCYSEVIPHEVEVRTCLVKDKDFCLQLPILSSAMDTVTNHQMAKVMAQLGALGNSSS